MKRYRDFPAGARRFVGGKYDFEHGPSIFARDQWWPVVLDAVDEMRQLGVKAVIPRMAGNSAHIAEHGLTQDEVDSVLFDENTVFDVSDSSGLPIAFGTTTTGRFIAVVFDVQNLADPLVIPPITAYDVPEPAE